MELKQVEYWMTHNWIASVNSLILVAKFYRTDKYRWLCQAKYAFDKKKSFKTLSGAATTTTTTSLHKLLQSQKNLWLDQKIQDEMRSFGGSFFVRSWQMPRAKNA